MALNIWALTIVKATGAEVPAVQLVFLRAATGLCLMLTWIALAALFLGERATPRRWAAAGIGLIGVLVATRPNGAGPDPALLALAVTVVTGTAAIVVTRRLNDQPTVVMMTAYTAGLALATAPLAWLGRVPVAPDLWPFCWRSGWPRRRRSSVSCRRIGGPRPGSWRSWDTPA